MRTTSKLVWTALLAASTCTLTGVAGVAAAPPSTAPAGTATYTVVNGDTLIGIATKMKIGLQALLDVNKFTVASLILPGQKIFAPAGAVIPPAGTPTTTAATKKTTGAPTTAATSPAAAAGITSAPTTYTVVANDYLIGIARRFAVPFSALLAANGFTATSLIYAGKAITIPAGATTTPAATPAPKTPAGQTAALTPTTTAAAAAPAATTTTVRPIAAQITPPPINIAPTGNAQIDTVLAFIKAQLGKPYIAYAAGPVGYDCSGLVMAAYATIGVKLIHQSGFQAKQGTAVDWTTAPIQAGDLVFTAGSSTPGIISHVGIAISSTQWVNATRPGAWVSVGSLPAAAKILAVRRYA